MKQFNLNEYFKDIDQNVVTRDGKQVRIICTDAPVKNYPVTGYVLGIDEKWHGPYSWSKDGDREIASPVPSANDLFFPDKEKNMTEFEKELAESYEWSKGMERNDFVEEFTPKLLNLAREQLKTEFMDKTCTYLSHWFYANEMIEDYKKFMEE